MSTTIIEVVEKFDTAGTTLTDLGDIIGEGIDINRSVWEPNFELVGKAKIGREI